MELQKTWIDGLRVVFDQTLVQEETLESIVPDACPDILRIVGADGEVCLKSRELNEGTLRLGGSIHAVVLYIPDGEPGPKKLEVRMPFVCSADDPKLHGDGRLVAAPRLCGVDAQIINPRKVLIRAQLAAAVQVMAPEALEICTGTSDGEEYGLQQRQEERTTYAVIAVQEKSFTFTDTLNLPSSRPDVEELLWAKFAPRCLDAKIIGSKLIVKGTADLSCLLRGEDGAVTTADFELPFSQILEASGAPEGGDITVETVLSASECSLQAGEPGSLSISLEILAQAVIRVERSMTLVTDLYCTQCPVDTERQALPLTRLVDRGVQRQSVRQLCESGLPVKNVVECALSIGRWGQTEAETGTGVFAGTLVSVLFYSEDDALCQAVFPIQAETVLPVEKGAAVSFSCRGTGELTATPVSGGMEVRFDVEFSYLAVNREECSMVTEARPLPVPEGAGPRPSVVLRVVGEGEPLWDIAKACSSTVADIITANELSGDSAAAGKLLLIPKQR